MPEFYHKLLFQRRVLLLLLLFLFAFSVLGGFSLYVILLAGINSFEPLQEATAWKCLVVGTLLSFLGLIGGWIRIYLKRPGPLELAALVESDHPELREDLSTAVELYMKQGGPRGALEEALFRKVENETAELSFRRSILTAKMHPLWFAVLVIGSLLLSDGATRSEVMMKARYHAMDRATGKNSGLVVEPGSVELPRGSDLLITARIERWEREAHIEYVESGRWVRHPMTFNPEGLAQIRLYGLEHNTTYRVATPSLRSPDYKVTLYDPPVLHGVRLQVVPPKYTRLESQEYSALLDLNVPAGSELTVVPEVDPDVEVKLLLDGREIPLSSKVYAGGSYQLALTNMEGRRAVTDRYRLQVIPDEPPLVEITEPARDVSLNPRDALPLRVYAADDYGLSAVTIRLSVSGLNRNPIVLHEASRDWPLEEGFEVSIDLERLGVEHGDVVVYFAEAGDNREPEPQVARTEVYFIEVSEKIEPGEPQEPPPGGGEKEEIDFRALIVESKRLIRQSYAALALQGAERERENQVIATALNNLGRQSRDVLEKAVGMFFMKGAADVFEVFRNSIIQMEEAERLLNQNLTEDSIAPQQEALSGLLVVESFFGSQSPPPSSGEAEPQEGGQGGGESSEGRAESEGKQQASISEMRKMLETMQELLAGQQALTQSYDRADRAQAGPEEMDELVKHQQALEKAQQSLLRDLTKLQEPGAEIRQQVRQAGREMERARGAAEEGNSGSAARSSLRAEDALLGASGLLESEIRRAAGREVRGLAQQTASLSSRQGQAAAESQQAGAGQLDAEAKKALEPGQRELAEEWKRLKRQLDSTAVEMNEIFPEIARELSRVALQAESSQVEAEMGRAVNALLYERFDRAARSQEAAAGELGAVAGELNKIASSLPQLSPGELRNLFEKVMQARREAMADEGGAEGEGEGESVKAQAQQQRRSQLGRQLGTAGEALGDRSLVEVGEKLATPRAGEGASGGEAPVQLLDQAARLLQEYLQTEWLKHGPGLGRPSAPAPEKYRRLVEEYFKNLVEEL